MIIGHKEQFSGMEGEASTEEGSQEGVRSIPSRMQRVGQRLSEAPCRAFELQRKQPIAACGQADSGYYLHHHLHHVAPPADSLRLPQAVYWRFSLPLPQLDVHWTESVLPDPGLRSGAISVSFSRIAADLRAVFHVLHDQRRIQLRSAHVPHERSRNGASRHADHLAGVQWRVEFLFLSERVASSS